MRRDRWLRLLAASLADIEAWEQRWPDPPLPQPDDAAEAALRALTQRLTANNYPFGNPRYAGQMLAPPHPVAWAAYAATMCINPNNHALDGGPATAQLEREAVAELAAMFGLDRHLGHLSASGTVANLEALWVARELTQGRAVAVGDNAHYTHTRMCQVLGLPVETIPQTPGGRIDLDALERTLASGRVGTVVATLGTTGLGAIDPLHHIVPLARAHGARVHVDAAYGGFFALLAQREPPLVAPAPFEAVALADSIVIDPHKRGLQPYGCGCVLFADPSVGTLYAHDSPYTYFTSSDLHLGEITLECSRAGAAAAALWTTMRAVPFAPHAGLGDMLAAGRRAALAWADAIEATPGWRLLTHPETDIVCFAPAPPNARASEISAAVERIFRRGMVEGDDACFLAKIRVAREQAAAHWPDIVWDDDHVVVLRSVLMKPEHEREVPRLHALVTAS